MLSAVLCGCNETGTFSEKKYTPVYVYLSTTPYVGESSMSDFVDYPSDLVRLGLRGTVKEVKTTSAAEMVQKFNEDGNLTSQGCGLIQVIVLEMNTSGNTMMKAN
jgi:hypothetical protein